MKNRILISFCINILIGILFSFPVFPVHSSYSDLSNSGSGSEFRISGDEPEIKSISVLTGNTFNFYPEDNFVKIHRVKDVKKPFTTGNKGKSGTSTLQHHLKYYFFNDLSSNLKDRVHSFVNLAYLKDLKTTKMLC